MVYYCYTHISTYPQLVDSPTFSWGQPPHLEDKKRRVRRRPWGSWDAVAAGTVWIRIENWSYMICVYIYIYTHTHVNVYCVCVCSISWGMDSSIFSLLLVCQSFAFVCGIASIDPWHHQCLILDWSSMVIRRSHTTVEEHGNFAHLVISPPHHSNFVRLLEAMTIVDKLATVCQCPRGQWSSILEQIHRFPMQQFVLLKVL